ncbi:DUF2626 family protein [Novibacillus thermophilus]|mgnify:CR=1 FL=1
MGMDRMFRVLAFFLFAITLMFFAGDMATVAGLFLFQALVFLVLSYFRLSERAYLFVFGGYMVIAFIGMVFWSFFMMGSS